MARVEPGWDDDGDLAPLRRRSPLTAVVAVLLVISLAGSAVAIAFGRNSGDDNDDDQTEVVPPVSLGEPPAPDTLDAVVEELSAFVAAARELEFKEPVTATLLDDEAFSARVVKDAVTDLAALDDSEAVLVALGLLDDGVDLAESLRQFLGAGVVGFYDAETGELVLRGAALTPYVRTTLVHELTHALDDQHFELHRPALDDADDESGTGFAALVEGNAVRVEEEYRATLSEDDQAEADREERRLGTGIDYDSLPPVVLQLIGFPYAIGPRLVDALLEAGGEDRVNAAFREPPVTTEQLLDPVGWLEGRAEPVTVAPPSADGEVFDEGLVGVLGLVLMLQTEVGEDDAVGAAQGWGGDWYVAWREGDDACVRATIAMDTADDLDELSTALEDWVAGQDDAELERGSGSVTFTACG